MVDRSPFTMSGFADAIRFVKKVANGNELKAMADLKKELDSLFEEYFVQRLVSKYEQLMNLGFDKNKAFSLTIESIENKLKTALEGSNQ
jgi:hypothetical protein